MSTDSGVETTRGQDEPDLDADGVFSTYERAGAADENGVNAASGLYIDNEVE